MREFVRLCLHFADTRSGDVVLPPLGETVHGTAPKEVVCYDYLYVDESGPNLLKVFRGWWVSVHLGYHG